MSKGIYTKENVGNGVFIFTVNKNFVEPKFWGLHEENEQAQCVVIIHDGNALFFYPEGRCVKMRTFFFYAQSPDFHKQGLCYYLKILYL